MCCEAFCCGALEGYFLNLVNMYYVNIVQYVENLKSNENEQLMRIFKFALFGRVCYNPCIQKTEVIQYG